jgi:signal transduction histidine kinase
MYCVPATNRTLWRSPSTIWLFLGLFVVAEIILFCVVYWLISNYLVKQVDERLVREAHQLIVRTPRDAYINIDDRGKREVANIRPYGLFEQNGTRLAGNIVDAPPTAENWRPYNYSQVVQLRHESKRRPFRAIAAPLTNGQRVVVGQAMGEIESFDKTLTHIVLGGLAFTILLGLSYGAALNLLSKRRIRAISEASREIVAGRLEQRLPVRGSNDDMDRLAVVVNSMLDDIERLVNEVRSVSAGIAHELRTPMTRLRGGLERVRRRSSNPAEYGIAIDDAIAQSDQVLVRFSALLRIAEVEAHARRASFCRVPIATVLRDVIELYEPLAQERALHLSLDLCSEAEEIELLGDAALLFGAIKNLVDNSLKFTPAGGIVTVSLSSSDSAVLTEISDTGPGIELDERQAVLRPFYRSKLHLEGFQIGHGLGLSLVAAIARLHGASLAIEDGSPGCSVKLRFPRA